MKCGCVLCLFERDGECVHRCPQINEQRICVSAVIFEDKKKLERFKCVTEPRSEKYGK